MLPFKNKFRGSPLSNPGLVQPYPQAPEHPGTSPTGPGTPLPCPRGSRDPLQAQGQGPWLQKAGVWPTQGVSVAPRGGCSLGGELGAVTGGQPHPCLGQSQPDPSSPPQPICARSKGRASCSRPPHWKELGPSTALNRGGSLVPPGLCFRPLGAPTPPEQQGLRAAIGAWQWALDLCAPGGLS